jgi:hypothetical protein
LNGLDETRPGHSVFLEARYCDEVWAAIFDKVEIP